MKLCFYGDTIKDECLHLVTFSTMEAQLDCQSFAKQSFFSSQMETTILVG